MTGPLGGVQLRSCGGSFPGGAQFRGRVYFRVRRGGRVFAAGVFSIKQAVLALLIENMAAFPVRALRHQLPTGSEAWRGR